MCSDVAIQVDAVSKCYQIYAKPLDRLKQSLWRGRRIYHRNFTAVDRVSLTVRKGETVGMVGRNGSGKSTLLQMVCGTLEPSYGEISITGKVAALLELGAGFNPEFTGRENVYMNAAIQGLSRDEIDARYDNIVEFAEIEDFMEQPVKVYSSGMYVRLAFAVAINVDPDVLIIDEALSVGDEAFKRKCHARIEQMKSNGVSILFVSHSAAAIIELCSRAILLDAGQMLMEGSPKHVVGNYQRLLYAPPEKHERIRNEIITGHEQVVEETDDRSEDMHADATAPGLEGLEAYDPNLVPSSTIEYESLGARIYDARLETASGHRINHLVPGRKYVYHYSVEFLEARPQARFGMMIKTMSGVEVAGAATKSRAVNSVPRVLEISFSFHCLLNPGTYFLNAGVQCNEGFLHRLLDAYMFRVVDEGNRLSTGIVDLQINSDVGDAS